MSKTRVRMLTSIAGPDFSYARRQVAEVDAKEAAGWIQAGIAEPADLPGPMSELDRMTVKQLTERAAELNVEVPARANKAVLVELITKAQAEAASSASPDPDAGQSPANPDQDDGAQQQGV